MADKRCFKCGMIKPLTEFYKHPKMGDGHLNKCKQCAKIDVRAKYLENSQNEEYMDKERARGRGKYRRFSYSKTDKARLKSSKFRNVRRAKKFFASRYIIGKECELHHWNYNLPYNVIMLHKRLHKRLHTKINFDLESGLYTFENKLIQTIEEHLKIIELTCIEFNFNYNEVQVLTA